MRRFLFMSSCVAISFTAANAQETTASVVREKIRAVSVPCVQAALDVANAVEERVGSEADRAIEICTTSLSGLNKIGENVGTISETDKRFLYYSAGSVQYSLAGIRYHKNPKTLDVAACNHAITGDKIWQQVNPIVGSKLERDMANAEFAKNITSWCKRALARSKE